MTLRTEGNITHISRSKPLVPSSKNSSGTKKSDSKKKTKKKEDNIIRGKEVTVKDSAAPGQVIYGTMKVGGVTTAIVTNSDSKAYIVTGSEPDENELLWTARTAGSAGNNITLKIEVASNQGSINVQVTDNNIVIKPRTTGTTITSTVNQIITAVQANGLANALVTVRKIFANTNGVIAALDTAPLQYGGGKWLHQIITVACHEITEVLKVWMDGKEVTFGAAGDGRWGTGIWAGKAFMAVNYGEDDQAAQADFRGQMPDFWRETDRQQGCAHIYLITIYDQNVYPEGEPDTEFLIKGKPVYDPRTADFRWSDNGVLCTYDLIKNEKFGLGSTLTCPTLSDMADIADQDITIIGGTEKRYRTSGSFDTTDGAEKILEELEQAIAGKAYERDGFLVIHPGHYISETSATFDEGDLRGGFMVNTHFSLDDSFNCARGSFVDPFLDYNEGDISPVKNATYIAQDGKEIWQDFTLNFVPSQIQCQRILKVELERIRQGITINMELKLCGLLVTTGNKIKVTNEEHGFNEKEFEVINATIICEQDTVVGVDIEAIETASGIYDWNMGEQTTVDLADNTELPTATDVAAPTLLPILSGTSELLSPTDGTIITRMKVSWVNNSEFVTGSGSFKLRYKQVGAPAWSTFPTIPGDVNFVHILDVQDGLSYIVELCAMNVLGIASPAVQSDPHEVIGKREPPSAVEAMASAATDYGISFQWPHIPDVDKGEYEIRVGESWEESLYVWRGSANTARWEHKAAGMYKFWIKSFDTSLNPQTEATLSELEIIAPGQPELAHVFDGPNILFNWTNPTVGSFKIYDFILSYGANYEAATQVATITAKNFMYRADFGGTRSFWLAARDIAGNIGEPGVVTLTIEPPNAVGALSGAAAEAVIQLDWITPEPSTLPVAYYNVYKGDTYDEALKIGEKYGTFHTYIERFGGTFQYHVEAVDTAGNIGTHQSASVTISPPKTFYIKADNDLLLNEAALLTNAVEVPRQPDKLLKDIFFPIETTVPIAQLPLLTNPLRVPGIQTFGDWWNNNGWENLQQAINEGHDGAFLTPTSKMPGQIKWRVDYEVTFANSFINFQYAIANVGDGMNITPSISISPDGVTWTTYNGTQVFAENFRYVEYILDFEAQSDRAFAKVITAQAIISLKRETEYITVDCLAANHATGGTPFTFVNRYVDIEFLDPTPWGIDEDAVIIRVPFQDVAYPTGGKVLFWDLDGTPLDGQVKIVATGAVEG